MDWYIRAVLALGIIGLGLSAVAWWLGQRSRAESRRSRAEFKSALRSLERNL